MIDKVIEDIKRMIKRVINKYVASSNTEHGQTKIVVSRITVTSILTRKKLMQQHGLDTANSIKNNDKCKQK